MTQYIVKVVILNQSEGGVPVERGDCQVTTDQGRDHVEVIAGAIREATRDALGRFIDSHVKALRAGLQTIEPDAAKVEEAQRVQAEIAPLWDEYVKKREALEQEFVGAGRKRGQIRKAIAELEKTERERASRF